MMKIRKPRHFGWIIAGVLIVGLTLIALWPRPIRVEQAAVQQQTFEVSIEADGVIQARRRFIIAMPATGILERLEIEAGEPVAAGQVVGYVIPPEIDARQRAQAQAHVQSLEAVVRELDQQLSSLSPMITQAKRRAERLERLAQSGAVSREQIENAADAHTQLAHQADALHERRQSAVYELQAARSILASRPGQRVPLIAPADGVVLRRYEQSERTVMAGIPVMEIGDTSAMEVVIDVLSVDAVKVAVGMPVLLNGWGGGDPLPAVVRRVEPAARTKVSSLGIEEQRVNVLADVLRRPASLGDGYRVEASIITQRLERALCVPLGALLRRGDQWSVFISDHGRARLLPVALGPRNALVASVLSGLSAGQAVIVHPPESLQDGDRIRE